MEHPEKKLFEEVLALKNEIAESKERVSKLKIDYNDKIILFEKRSLVQDRSEEKFKKWQTISKKKVTFLLDEKEHTFLRTTFENNLYKIDPRYLPDDNKNIFIDAQKSFFKLFIRIIIKGNSEFNRRISNQNEEIYKSNFANVLDKSTREDQNFFKFLQEIFEAESFHDVVNNFNLNLEIFPKKEGQDLFIKYAITSPHSSNFLTKYVSESVVSLADKKSKMAFFIGYNGNLDIELGETVRVKKFFVKPFSSDVNWIPTSGATHTIIYVSTDGKNWEHAGNVPSYFGTSTDDYLCVINLNNLFTFRFVRFSTTSNSFFSLNYFALKK